MGLKSLFRGCWKAAPSTSAAESGQSVVTPLQEAVADKDPSVRGVEQSAETGQHAPKLNNNAASLQQAALQQQPKDLVTALVQDGTCPLAYQRKSRAERLRCCVRKQLRLKLTSLSLAPNLHTC